MSGDTDSANTRTVSARVSVDTINALDSLVVRGLFDTRSAAMAFLLILGVNHFDPIADEVAALQQEVNERLARINALTGRA